MPEKGSSLLVFVVDASLGRMVIETFALHHVGHALLKRGDDADVQVSSQP